jgi:hypothetical protein
LRANLSFGMHARAGRNYSGGINRHKFV